MLKLIPVVITILFLAACNNGTSFVEYKKFDNSSWNRFDILEFEFPVQKKDALDFYLVLQHHADFHSATIDINITIYTPDGEMRSRDYHFKLKDSNLNWKGDEMNDTLNIQLPIRKELLFNKGGICKVKIENKMSRVETQGISAVGLIVKNSSTN